MLKFQFAQTSTLDSVNVPGVLIEENVHVSKGLGQLCPIELSAIMEMSYNTLSNVIATVTCAIKHLKYG